MPQLGDLCSEEIRLDRLELEGEPTRQLHVALSPRLRGREVLTVRERSVDACGARLEVKIHPPQRAGLSEPGPCIREEEDQRVGAGEVLECDLQQMIASSRECSPGSSVISDRRYRRSRGERSLAAATYVGEQSQHRGAGPQHHQAAGFGDERQLQDADGGRRRLTRADPARQHGAHELNGS